MTHRDERAVGTAVLALMAIACLAAALLLPWFEYDHSSGRKTAPDAAYNQGEDGVVDEHMTFYATSWEGDVQPSDEQTAQTLTILLPAGLAAAALCLLVVALGEIRTVHRLVPRRTALVLVGLAFAFAAATAILAWVVLPQTMAGYGVTSQYTARLDEPDGYTSSTMMWGWYALAASLVPILGAALFKFQAGLADLEVVASLLHKQEGA